MHRFFIKIIRVNNRKALDVKADKARVSADKARDTAETKKALTARQIEEKIRAAEEKAE